MEITISNLYPDLFNHYGDAGNITVLRKRLEKRAISVNLQNCSAEELDLASTDILYIGGATERSLAAVYDSIYKIRDSIRDYAEKGGVILAACTGFEMLGESFETESTRYDGLGVLKCSSKRCKKRIIGNIVIKCEALGFDIVGFENHISIVSLNGHTPLGKVLVGHADTEGTIYKNVTGTQIHGPVLPKNPLLADYIIKCAVERKYGDCILTELDDELEIQAHNYMKEKYLK